MNEVRTPIIHKYNAKDISISVLRSLFIIFATVLYCHFQSTVLHRNVLWAGILGGIFAAFALVNPIIANMSKRLRLPVIIGVALISAIIYALHLTTLAKSALLPEVSSSLIAILFSFVVCLSVPTFINPFFDEQLFAHDLNPKDKNRFWKVVLIALLIHIFATLLGVFIYSKFYNGAPNNVTFMQLYRRAWVKLDTDVPHYFKIAQNGYVATGNDRLLIVFFPLFPMLLRIFNFIFKDSFISGIIINAVCSCLSAGMMYKVISQRFSESTAFFAAVICTIMPGSVFFNSPMTEPLFLLLTLCSLYFILKREYIAAGIFAALTGLTRSVGILLFASVFIGAVYDIVWKLKKKEKILPTVLNAVFGLLISTLGTIIYLYINKKVFGNPFMFKTFQDENWNQGIAYFFDTARYIFEYSVSWLKSGKIDLGLNVGVATLITMFISLIIYAFAVKKMPPTFNIYFLGYYVITMGCTWLLSAVRYMSVSIPLIAAIAFLPKKRISKIIVLVILIALYVLYIYNYATVKKLY